MSNTIIQRVILLGALAILGLITVQTCCAPGTCRKKNSTAR
jgi:hypothetical protein